MQLIQFPFHRVILNVLANSLQIWGVSDDVVVIISLPNACPGHITGLVDMLGRLIFEIGDDFA